MRSLILLMAAVPLAAQAPRTPQLMPFQEQKALALLRTQLSCLGCHELGGDGGRSAPSLTNVSERRDAAYIRAVIDDPQRVVPGAMPRVLMRLATRELIVNYLAVPPSSSRAVLQSRPSAVAPSSSRAVLQSRPSAVAPLLYQTWCANCHGPKGNGDGPNAKFLPVRPAIHSSAAQMSPRSDDVLFDAIAGGGAVMGKSARMPPFGATLTPGEIRALVAYIRELCACKGPAWSLDGNR